MDKPELLRGTSGAKNRPDPQRAKLFSVPRDTGTFLARGRFTLAATGHPWSARPVKRGWQMDDQEERIRRRAHEIWVLEGKPEGREADHWFQAREFIRTEDFLISMSTPNPALEADAVAVENAEESGRAVAYHSSDAGPTEVPSSTEVAPAAARDRPTSKRTSSGKGMESFRGGAKPKRPLSPQWNGVH
jgi:hypothetical protein